MKKILIIADVLIIGAIIAFFIGSVSTNGSFSFSKLTSTQLDYLAANMPESDFKVPGLNMEMIYVSPGNFLMGTNHGDHDEKPVHLVSISKKFWIGKYEVSQRQYKLIMGQNPSSFQDDANPVEMVNWHDAMKFCKRLTKLEREAGRLNTGYVYRLPTEAEWEYAARGGDSSAGFHYCGDNDVDHVAWYYSNSEERPHQAGLKGPNELGIHDMSGNLWEWCLDKYGSYEKGRAVDPSGPSNGRDRIYRGGSWYYFAGDCRPTSRSRIGPYIKNHDLGFRCVFAPEISNIIID